MISIIITTKNEEQHINKCLQSIKEQTYPKEKVEVIVVDNNSSDKTKEIAQKYGVRFFNAGIERSAQRNFGARQAQNEILLFLDADMILSPGVVTEIIDKMQNQNLKGLHLNEKILGNTFFSKVRSFEREFYFNTLIDAVRCVRKTDFQKINGFDESLTGPEDWDFDKRIRQLGKTDLLSAVVYHNEEYLNLKKLLKKKKYYSQNFKIYIQKWGKQDSDIKKQLGFKYRYIQVFFEKGKYKKVLQHPLLFISLIFLKTLIGIVYLLNKKDG
ncbi:glycosyltransferase [Patescibacteria group bacterium]